MRSTVIYTKNGPRHEELTKFKNFLNRGRLKPGQIILLGSVLEDSGVSFNTHKYHIGDCTPYHQPSDNDAGVGWSDPYILGLWVLEVEESHLG